MTTLLNNINAAPAVPSFVPNTPAAQQAWIAEEVKKAEIAKSGTNAKNKPTLLQILGSVGNVVTSLFGAKNATATNPIIYQAPVEKKDNTIWIVLAIVVVLVITGIILLSSKKSN